MVESVYGRMNELFKLSARMKNATNLEKCTWMKTVMAVVSLECTGLLFLSYTECLTELNKNTRATVINALTA